MLCTKCDFDNPPGMHFCGHCGTPLKQKCNSCGFNNPADFEFCGKCATRLTDENVNPDNKTITDPSVKPPQAISNLQEAERRQLSVLFCDIVGSSALSARIDPEELRDIMRDYRATCSQVIKQYNGYIAQYLGDGVLVYFGYPHAHEDDARRAVYAALDIIKQIQFGQYSTQQGEDIHISVRIGIHTGLVVVGEIGDGDKRTLALGETPNIAARIQDHASANCLVVSATTHQLLDNHFESISTGSHELKGFNKPLELFNIVRVFEQKNLLAKAERNSDSLLIGRDQETTLLLERLEQSRKGVGQIVLVGGEPGMGKTRIAQMICTKALNDSCVLLECAGSPYYQNSFLFPIKGMIRRLLNFEDATTDEGRLSHIEKTIATLGLNVKNTTPILADLLSVAINGQYSLNKDFTPLQKKQQTLDALVLLLQAIATQRFVLLVVEDLQWVDPSTLELLTQFTQHPGLTNIFALFTYRNHYSPTFPSRANLTRINLNLLTKQQSGSLIRHLCKRKTLPLEVFSEIINKTDGIPLFIEELTKSILRSNILTEKDDHYIINEPLSKLGIPATLQDSLMSRLDDLAEDKELVQISSIIGREFDFDLLKEVTDKDAESLQISLNRLTNAEVLIQRGTYANTQYQFRHALLREVAYHSLLKRTRKTYHQKIAILIKERFPQIAAENPELLAHHYTQSDNYDDALISWLAAGRYAVQRSANIEAISHLQNGLSIIQKIPDTPQLRLREIALQTTLGLATIMSKGYGDPEVEQAFVRAHLLCEDISDKNVVFPIISGLWEFYIVRADINKAINLAKELDHFSQKSPTPDNTLEANRALGTSYFWQGNFTESLRYLEQYKDDPLEIHDSSSNLLSYSQDSRVATLANASIVLWLTGRPDQALNRSQQALNLAKRLSHPFSQAYALQFCGTVSQLCGDKKATHQYAEAQIALSETYGFPFWAATGKMHKAWSEDNCENFQLAFKQYEASGNRLARSYFQSVWSVMLIETNKTDDAEMIINQALHEIMPTGELFFKAELLRIKGEIEKRKINVTAADAEVLFNSALELARSQKAQSLSLRASINLTQLWQKYPEICPDNIHLLLLDTLSHITGGSKTADHIDAQKLLSLIKPTS